VFVITDNYITSTSNQILVLFTEMVRIQIKTRMI